MVGNRRPEHPGSSRPHSWAGNIAQKPILMSKRVVADVKVAEGDPKDNFQKTSPPNGSDHFYHGGDASLRAPKEAHAAEAA